MEHPLSDNLVRSLIELAKDCSLQVLDHLKLPPREARLAPPPPTIHPQVLHHLEHKFPRGLFVHQSSALDAVAQGSDVCLATSTASGKSLVFMAATVDLLLNNPSARAAVFYPAKALLQDQKRIWQDFLRDFHLSVEHIDGSVPREQREAILEHHRVILLTPDVTHAWLLADVSSKVRYHFLSSLRLLVIDEAHVYDGVFGSNMAFLLRRIQAMAPIERIISSTATLGNPSEFIWRLSGRKPLVIGNELDGAPRPDKTILLVTAPANRAFDSMTSLLAGLVRLRQGVFLAFADSRRMVEQLVSSTMRASPLADAPHSIDNAQSHDDPSLPPLLPFRAGYEEEDRQAIQRALSLGRLAGVASTSALELGLDIGHIDIVVLLGTPPSLKAFWQRVGRGGRRRPGVCILFDTRGTVLRQGLQAYLASDIEDGWIYLDNRYLQFANALCAAQEASQWGPEQYLASVFESLPNSFREFFQNELNPTANVPDDLYPLKQRAQAGPHLEFPLRSGVEKEFTVKESTRVGQRMLGNLTYSQALREAYPGGIYYYMAQPKRVQELRYRTGEIFVRSEKRWVTQPILQNKVFPIFDGGILQLSRAETGYLCEAEVQVSERVIGFVEIRGPTRERHMYERGSAYSQTPIQNHLRTTGVCWMFKEVSAVSYSVAEAIRDAYGAICGIETKDLGVGDFFSRTGPLGPGENRGICIYDAIHGSLRLTEKLYHRFQEVLTVATELANSAGPEGEELVRNLATLSRLIAGLEQVSVHRRQDSVFSDDADDWVTLVAPGSQAFLAGSHAPKEVNILGYRYTPQGLLYQLEHDVQKQIWLVAAKEISPIPGISKLIRVNLVTGEEIELE